MVYTVVSEMELRLGWNRSVPNKTLRYQEWLQGLELSVSCTTKVNLYTVKKEMLCSGDSEILYEIVRETTLKSEKHHELFRVVSRNPCFNVKFYFGSI